VEKTWNRGGEAGIIISKKKRSDWERGKIEACNIGQLSERTNIKEDASKRGVRTGSKRKRRSQSRWSTQKSPEKRKKITTKQGGRTKPTRGGVGGDTNARGKGAAESMKRSFSKQQKGNKLGRNEKNR